jgi:Kef-type K+ transport system membrane component KefB
MDHPETPIVMSVLVLEDLAMAVFLAWAPDTVSTPSTPGGASP